MPNKISIPDETIISRIFVIRGQNVMIDRDLAELYGVETKQLKRQVRRNIERFPSSCMFELTKEENQELRSQIGTLKKGTHFKYPPFVFTEHGILMLSSVLSSERAVQMNIHIIRTFIRLRKLANNYEEILVKIKQIESKTDERFSEMSQSNKSEER